MMNGMLVRTVMETAEALQTPGCFSFMHCTDTKLKEQERFHIIGEPYCIKSSILTGSTRNFLGRPTFAHCRILCIY